MSKSFLPVQSVTHELEARDHHIRTHIPLERPSHPRSPCINPRLGAPLILLPPAPPLPLYTPQLGVNVAVRRQLQKPDRARCRGLTRDVGGREDSDMLAPLRTKRSLRYKTERGSKGIWRRRIGAPSTRSTRSYPQVALKSCFRGGSIPAPSGHAGARLLRAFETGLIGAYHTNAIMQGGVRSFVWEMSSLFGRPAVEFERSANNAVAKIGRVLGCPWLSEYWVLAR
ncbi:hypothetical protein R3P38DRAFT_3188492 [Favolaschia claudopus]|uniref:Uncharacterized protein n=1 Tax=Favolaschia claudopus TaxID=2862362 RepID=A0AAW0BV95_9AGAR